MTNEVKLFLKHLENCQDDVIKDFVKECNKKTYEIVSKIIKKHDLSVSEYEYLKNKCCTQYYTASALMQSNNTPTDIKHLIVDNLLNNKIDNMNNYNRKQLISNILKHHNDLFLAATYKLFNNYFSDSLYQMTFFTSNPNKECPYCSNIANRFAEFFIDVLNTTLPMPREFTTKMSPIPCVDSPRTFDYIIKNMPKTPEMAEFVSGQLINNPNLSETEKNKLFDEYGYNYCTCQKLNLTPYISRSLYASAIDSLYDYSSFATPLTRETTKGFIERCISCNAFDEAIQIDLVNRVLSDAKRKGLKKSIDILENISFYTKSPKVLHIIFEQAPHVNDRDGACRNVNISSDDLQKHADIYCNKIATVVKKKSSNKHIPPKWVDEIEFVLRRKGLKSEQYQMLANSNIFTILKVLVKDSNTPIDIVEKVTQIAQNNYKATPYNHHAELYGYGKLHIELLNRNCCNQNQLDFITSLFRQSYRLRKTDDSFLNCVILDNYLISEDSNFCTQVSESFNHAFSDNNDIFSDIEIRDKYLNQINEYLSEKSKIDSIPGYLKTENLDTIPVSKLLYRLKRNTDNFKREIRQQNAFLVIEEHAHRHAVFSKAIENYPKGQEESITERGVIHER